MYSTTRTIVSAILLVAASTTVMADDRSAQATSVDASIETVDQRSAFWAALHHIPFNQAALGIPRRSPGAAQLSGVGNKFAAAPRVSPKHALTYRHTTMEHDTSSTGADADVTIVSVTSAVLFKLGYAMIW